MCAYIFIQTIHIKVEELLKGLANINIIIGELGNEIIVVILSPEISTVTVYFSPCNSTVTKNFRQEHVSAYSGPHSSCRGSSAHFWPPQALGVHSLRLHVNRTLICMKYIL